ncbi:hypothetical protein JYU34_018577 [Plutella xylostella]|nr:hypothetical protein JYU34_018577 [Plutella xylostella]
MTQSTSCTVKNQPNLVTKKKSQKTKICLLTCNIKNVVLDIAKSIFTEKDYDFCHFLTPYAGIKDQLNGLNKKLSSYTMDDFCIVMIGEEDFTKTNNYHGLITHIRNVLENIEHTNVIICTPTFKYGQHQYMFNGRVELFNHLLYSDVLKNEYAYLWDSNTTLLYDHSMFYRGHGHLNNRGLRNILNCIHQQIKMHENYDEEGNNKHVEEIPDDLTASFFRTDRV